ncbi:hypothetical protein B9T24_15280 [Acinetobacter sp. ANC 4654]|uniref:hypothetical protein n=1 Tax=Acinetobacter sp. ANC 4654 TaxID=1977872 RepID=UPI000A35BEB5|nr:hypothetical protein [Acinetobacter sp. ANC 4654]OTG92727.1 hypothetical protein B9T24_15280 [Acinetobacter sp. ANC 4654]
MSIENIGEDGFLDTLRIVGGSSGGVSANTRLATVRWPDGKEADTFIKIFPVETRSLEIINESFGFLMAQEINLRQSPRVALIKISVDDIPSVANDIFAQENGYYYAWACRSIGGENMKKMYFKPPYDSGSPQEFLQYFDALSEWDHFSNLIAFDDCVGNCDRNPGNIIFLGKNNLAIIDHGLIFGGSYWSIDGLQNANNFENLMLNNFIQQHNNAPSHIAWQPVIDCAANNVSKYSTFWDKLFHKIIPVFQVLIPNIQTVSVVAALLINYLKNRVLSSASRFTSLSTHYSSLGAVAP